MLNPNKVKLMTKIAVEDKKHSMVNNKVSGITLTDYIFINCFYAFIAYSICFIIVSMAILVLFFESMVDLLLNFNIADAIWIALGIYLIGLVIYLLVIIYTSIRRYNIDRKYIIRNNKRIMILKNRFHNER